MEKLLGIDPDIVVNLSALGYYDYVIVGSGFGGGVLAEELVKEEKKVLLIERGGPTFTTHICNTPRPDFGRGKNDSPEGNEIVYNTIKERVQTAEDSEPYVGGPMYCLGGRSNVWGLWIPEADNFTLEEHFPKEVHEYLQTTGFREAFNLVTNNSQTIAKYPRGHLPPGILETVTERLQELIDAAGVSIPGHEVDLGPIATELNSPSPYRFPQGAYSTVIPLLNRIYARDKYLTVLMDTQVLRFDTSTPFSKDPTQFPSVSSLTVRSTANQRISQINTKNAKVILSAGTIGTASIALNSGLQEYNPLVGKGLIDHEIWAARFAKRSPGVTKTPINLQCLVNILDRKALLTVTLNANLFLAGSTTVPISEYWDRKGVLLAPQKGRRDIEQNDYDTIAILIEFKAELDDQNEVLNIPAPDPVIRMRRRDTVVDEKLQLEMRSLAATIRNKIFNLPIELDASPLSLLGLGVFSHEVGTMRMEGPTDGAPSVVDKNLKVHGLENLYACDLSVFPVSTPANPTLTLTGLSMRLAKHLMEQTEDASAVSPDPAVG